MIFTKDAGNNENLNLGLFALLLISSLLTHLTVPYIHIAVYNILLPLLSFALIGLNYRKCWDAYKHHRKALFFLFLLYVWIWISALMSEYRSTALKYSIKYSIYFIMFAGLVASTYQCRVRFSYYRIVYRFIFILALFGIFEFLCPNSPVFTFIRSTDSLSVQPRVASLLQWPNQYAVLISIGMTLAFILYQKMHITKYELYGSILFFPLTIALAASRNGWLVFLISLILMRCYAVIVSNRVFVVIGIWFFGAILLFPVSTHQLGIEDNKVFPLLSFLEENNEKKPKCVFVKKNIPLLEGDTMSFGVEISPDKIAQQMMKIGYRVIVSVNDNNTTIYKKRLIYRGEDSEPLSFNAEVDLSAFAGEKVNIIFKAIGTPCLNVSAMDNWAGWKWAKIVNGWDIRFDLFNAEIDNYTHKVTKNTSPDGTTKPLEALMPRSLLWKEALKEFRKRPIAGAGIETFSHHMSAKVKKNENIMCSKGFLNAHNLFINVLVELGMPGLFLFFIFIYHLLRKSKITEPLIFIPLVTIIVSQVFDFFLYDITFMSIVIYFLSASGNMKNDHQ